MKVTAIVPFGQTGAFLYSKKLYSRLPARTISSQRSLIASLLHGWRETDLYHIQYEYRGFGSFPKSLALLGILTLILGSRRPVVITLHGLIIPQSVSRRKTGWLSYFSYLSTIKLVGLCAAAFVVQSDLMRRVIEETYGISKAVVIPCGTDSNELSSLATGANLAVVFFGFIRPSKGIDNLIDAIPRVQRSFPGVELTIAGSVARTDETSYLAYLRRKVEDARLSDCVKFQETDFGNAQERTQLLRRASVVVLPYTDWFVEISAVVHDVAQYGLPLICSKVPRFSELVDGFDCVKTSPDSTSLAEAIVRVLGDSDLRSKLGANLQLKVKEESWETVANYHMLLYNNILREKGLIEDIPGRNR